MNIHLKTLKNMIAVIIVFSFASNSIAMESRIVEKKLEKLELFPSFDDRCIAYKKTIVEPDMMQIITARKCIQGSNLGKIDAQVRTIKIKSKITREYSGENAEKIFEELQEEYESPPKSKLI